MAIRAFRITVPETREDEVAGLLWELGTQGIEVQRARDGESALLAYFPGEPPLDELRERLAVLSASMEPVPVPEVDWVARFRDSFRGFTVGRFRIAPPWDPPRTLLPDEQLLRIDPGRAFGTGTHESTRLCLREIEASFENGKPRCVLDIGTGTGILATAAALLGAGVVVAVDNDSESLASARHHAHLNGVAVLLVRGNAASALRPGQFDLVLANLTAPLLRTHAGEIIRLLAPCGVLVLSGL